MAAFVAALLSLTTPTWAGNYTPPAIQGYVTDTAGVLSLEEVAALDKKLATYRQCSTNHVVVFVPATLGGELRRGGIAYGRVQHVEGRRRGSIIDPMACGRPSA